uniref:Ubiquitin-like domain-containing protein n=1 Tax=Rhabditophanes sp. KR3021 TaxID=114890 RepID=A0AC35TU55_9BILA
MASEVENNGFSLGATAEFTIRSSVNNCGDQLVNCPVDWTVLQLKEHLKTILPSNPDVPVQKLIYSGKCLEDGETLKQILLKSQQYMQDDPAEVGSRVYVHDNQPKVIHLVLPVAEQPTPTTGQSSEDAARVGRNGNARQTTSNTVPPNAQTFSGGSTSYATITNFDPMNPYHVYYQNYFNYIMMYQNAYLQHMQTAQNDGNAEFVFPNIAGQMPQAAFNNIGNNNNNNEAAAPQAQPNEEVGFNGGVALSAIRIAMLVVVLFSYVSLERFGVVFGVGLVMYLIKWHRDRTEAHVVAAAAAERERNAPQPAETVVNEVQVQPAVPDNEIANGHDAGEETVVETPTSSLNNESIGTNQEVLPTIITEEVLPPVSIVRHVFNTVNGVMSSFIYSLVPEDPNRINANANRNN